jgi:hypothetical protein
LLNLPHESRLIAAQGLVNRRLHLFGLMANYNINPPRREFRSRAANMRNQRFAVELMQNFGDV